MKYKDLVGQVFNRLTVIAQCDKSFGFPKRRWVCQCICETVTYVETHNLVSGNTQSCGCLQPERTREAKTTHGQGGKGPGKTSKEYQTWAGMIQRCYNPNGSSYDRYGAIGIKMCDRWMEFENFFADMGPRPSDDHSIDRIDSTGDYTPENCRWGTIDDQNSNKRTTRIIEFNGIKQPLFMWTRQLKINCSTLLRRLKNWSLEEALTTPNMGTKKRPNQSHHRMIEFNGERKMLTTWAREIGISYSALNLRLRTGWTPEEALTTPKLVHQSLKGFLKQKKIHA